MSNTGSIVYPYLPLGRSFTYVDATDVFMNQAKGFARRKSLDSTMPCAVVIVRDGSIIGAGANGSKFHQENPCQRIALGCKSGQGYELCEGCHPKNHAEPSAIRNALERGNDTNGAAAYLWGHWWCCEPCWDSMIAAGIGEVYLLDGSERLFSKDHPDSIVGRQFV